MIPEELKEFDPTIGARWCSGEHYQGTNNKGVTIEFIWGPMSYGFLGWIHYRPDYCFTLPEVKCKEYMDSSVIAWNRGDKELSMLWLARASHLLQDVCDPEHTWAPHIILTSYGEAWLGFILSCIEGGLSSEEILLIANNIPILLPIINELVALNSFTIMEGFSRKPYFDLSMNIEDKFKDYKLSSGGIYDFKPTTHTVSDIIRYANEIVYDNILFGRELCTRNYGQYFLLF